MSYEITDPNQWEVMQRQCKAFITSEFLPEHITHEGSGGNKHRISLEKALAKAITIVTIGREIGVPPLLALRTISIIKGKPCLQAELILGLCYQKIPTFSLEWITTSAIQAKCRVRRNDKQAWQEFSFSIEDAKTAQLLGNPNSGWAKYPAALLRARATTAACRAVAPDATMNLYSVEEMGGEIIDATPTQETLPNVDIPAVSEFEAPEPAVTTSEVKIEAPEPVKSQIPARKPTVPTSATGKQDWKGKIITKAQSDKIHILKTELRMDDMEYRMHLQDNFLKSSSKELTQEEASKFIGMLIQWQKEGHDESDETETKP